MLSGYATLRYVTAAGSLGNKSEVTDVEEEKEVPSPAVTQLVQGKRRESSQYFRLVYFTGQVWLQSSGADKILSS